MDNRLVLRASEQAEGTFPVAELCPPVQPQPQLPQQPYELGLTSAGAISAGAYIAGVMDFLVQALDTWQAAKADPSNQGHIPSHDVLVRVLTGASAGAINAALLAVLRDRAFKHLASDPNPGGGEQPTGNPIFDTWVNRIGIDNLLADNDITKGQTPRSLLDGSVLPIIAQRALADASTLPAIERRWLADPLRVILTQTNSRGAPYFVPFANSTAGQGMMQHGDQARFAIAVPGSPAQHPAFPDELPLSGPPAPGGDWTRLTDAAIASGAFPIGLPPRQMQAKPEDYAYRTYFQDGGDLVVVPPKGEGWPAPGTPAYTKPQPYVGIDGGVIDNDPFGVAHDILAGGCGQNPREGERATRSVLMVNPFPEVPDYGPAQVSDLSLFSAFTNLLSVMKQQARFNPKDLMLANLEAVFSRFIVVSKAGKPINGKYSLACGFLGGFGGFISRKQRVHDFMLGRRNAQKLLLDHMVLPADNPLFDGWRDQPFAAAYYALDNDGNVARDDRGQPFLPIIPLLRDGGGISIDPQFKIPEQKEEPWPVGAVDPAAVAKQVEKRARALGAALTSGLDFFTRLAARLALSIWGYGALRDKVQSYLKEQKKEWDL